MRWLGAKVFTQNFSRHLCAILCHYGPYVPRWFTGGPSTAIIVAIIICPLVVINHSQLYPVAVVKIQQRQQQQQRRRRLNRGAKSSGKYLKGFRREGRFILGQRSRCYVYVVTGPKICACGLKRTRPFISDGDKSCGNRVRDKHTHSFATNAFTFVSLW